MGPRQAQGVYIETTLLVYSIFGTELDFDRKNSDKNFGILYISKFHENFRFSSQNVSDFPQSFVENSWFVHLSHIF